MAISDLTNTTWVLNESGISLPSTTAFYEIYGIVTAKKYADDTLMTWNDLYYINFYVNEINFTDSNSDGAFEYKTSVGYWNDILHYPYVRVKEVTITFTGGEDVTNAALISWLETNAVQQIPLTPKEQFISSLDDLAIAINTKAGTTGKKSIPEMKTIVDGIAVAKPEQTKSEALSMSSGNQVVVPDSGYVMTQVTIEKPASLVASNIKTGVTIGGVQGTFTSDANATASEILSGKSVYVNGSKVDGSITSLGATTYNTSSSDQTISGSKYLSGNQTILAVTTSGIVASNIVEGTTVKVGDANDDDRIASVTGTAPSENTVYGALTSQSWGTASLHKWSATDRFSRTYGPYEFETDMSFGQWVNSTYNTDEWTIDASDKIVKGGFMYLKKDNAYVLKQNTVEATDSYVVFVDN